MTGYVYKLIDPVTNKIIYIGSTINSLNIRLSCHISYSKNARSPLYRYIREHKIIPIIEMVEEVSFNHRSLSKLRWAEHDNIQMCKELGIELLNETPVRIKKKTYRPNIGGLQTMPQDVIDIIGRERLKGNLDRINNGGKNVSTSTVIINIIREWESIRNQS